MPAAGGREQAQRDRDRRPMVRSQGDAALYQETVYIEDRERVAMGCPAERGNRADTLIRR
jgi:hypothetical protein